MITTPHTTGRLAELLGCELVGSPDVSIESAETIEHAQPNQLTFLSNKRYRKYLEGCQAGAIIVEAGEAAPDKVVRLVCKHPYLSFCQALELLYADRSYQPEPGIHPSAVIHPTAQVGDKVKIGAQVEIAANAVVPQGCVLYKGAYVGMGAALGENCIIGVNAVIRHDVKLGDRVIIGDGSVIGFDGFGYVPVPEGYRKLPQVGTVELADDVEIGANCCIDRATVGATRIGKGSKLDNLIQIAHGVHIGEHTVIAAQTGISGSTKIGSRVMIGGQVGMVGHIEIGDRMIIGAQSGVTKSVNTASMISGYPARPQNEWLRNEAALNKLPQLIKTVEELKRKLEEPGDK